MTLGTKKGPKQKNDNSFNSYQQIIDDRTLERSQFPSDSKNQKFDVEKWIEQNSNCGQSDIIEDGRNVAHGNIFFEQAFANLSNRKSG